MATTLITGTNRGIGLEFVRQYAQDGWYVIACCRQPEKAEDLSRLTAQYPDHIRIYALDVADHQQIDQLARSLTSETIDLLINNAGIYPPSDDGGFGSIDYAAWIQAMQINTMAPLKMAEAFITQISSSNLKTIATITSKMGSIADNQRGGSYIYRSSKAAVNMVARSLAIDLKPRGITSVLLHPGWVKTDMGGRDALISTEQSVTGMRRILSGVALADTGKFFAYDGQLIPW
ncbi:SDR family oxidoreductase [Nitrosomonas sp. Nm132]|jgi:NAD(P)-dependent dehydrogenase (short-subunit alcohol dehydrogenase family)|uniref:SDR family oxidoreductase n=1 Tax=Nitrosomonas sp. Nm132 TaxID=1881053 RepID=UPI00088EF960|nr:SDR family oxidoreductase [Nitrosomonas sp. Nm132]SDH54628.1 NAD(P)-dependent dehydrogenase, short-chain alcohol dehydrogenase family [Nitrosomonas sp. Nm132]